MMSQGGGVLGAFKCPPPPLDPFFWVFFVVVVAWLLVREVGDVQGYIPVPRYGKVRKKSVGSPPKKKKKKERKKIIVSLRHRL